jgi:pimeloyl-ACP methyl ester carboxylesterase
MSASNPRHGVFYGDIPYACWGTGSRKMLIFAGGPGNTVPGKFVINNFYHEFDPFTKEYTLYLVARRKGQPEGYSTRDMSNDYAEMIKHDLGGHVDVVIGTSMGGMIAQHFAADHAALADHIVIALAAHQMSAIGKEIDLKFAQYLSQGKPRKALVVIAEALYPPGFSKYLYTAVFWLLGRTVLGRKHAAYEQDVMVEVRAELAHESRDSLARVRVPVLIICGTADVYFPREIVEEMAGLIKGSSLKMYPGKGHMGTLEDESFSKDVFEFIGRNG